MKRLENAHMIITSLEEQLQRAKDGHVTKWMVDRLIVQSGLNMIYAPSGTLKSLSTLDLVYAAVIPERKWLRVFDVGQQRVLYVDEDSNNDCELNSRLLGFGPVQPSEDRPGVQFMLNQGFRVTDDRLRRAMIDDCLDEGITLIILDSLTRLHDQAENTASGMKVVTAALREFTMSGITLVVLHHATKTGKTFRGSSEIEAGCDSILSIERIDANSFRMLPSKTRSVAKSGVFVGCIIRVEKDDDGHLVLDGSERLDGGIGVDAPVVVDRGKLKRNRMRSEIIRCLSINESMTESSLTDACDVASRDLESFGRVLAGLVEEGILGQMRKGNGNYYCLLKSDVAGGETEGGHEIE